MGHCFGPSALHIKGFSISKRISKKHNILEILLEIHGQKSDGRSASLAGNRCVWNVARKESPAPLPSAAKTKKGPCSPWKVTLNGQTLRRIAYPHDCLATRAIAFREAGDARPFT